MNFNFSKSKWTEDSVGTWLMLLLPRESISTAKQFICDKLHTCAIKEYRPKRSLNANNYSWLLSDQLADALRISKEECHFLMLKRYGQKTVVSVVKEASETLKGSVEYWESAGESELNGKTFEHIKVFKGSKNFSSKEMAIFVDGIISECKEQGIETMTPDEIERLKGGWKP